MKSKIKKPTKKTKDNEEPVRFARKSESEIICATTTISKTTVESKSSSEENEQSGIEAELLIDVKKKIFLKDGGIIEIDKNDGPIKGDYGIVGLMERGNSKALFALHYESRNSNIKRLQFGETIKELRDRFGEFSIATSLKLSYLTIECIEEIHKIGFIHRAVYAIGLETEESQLYLLDWVSHDVISQRTKIHRCSKKRNRVHRMGNIRYMSRSSHKWMERSRKDDLESWLYMIVEFFLTTSSLPWEDEEDYDRGLPAGVNTIVRQINTFQYETKPDYHLIKNIFRNAILQGNYKSEKLDWLKGKEGEMLRAGACESKIFGEKSERELSQRSERSIKQTKKEYNLRLKSSDEQRSVFMMPKAERPIGLLNNFDRVKDKT
ncbi:hypothetical protein DINM_022935 [Dirofilaria immitis]|nr:hypothetical protein [Dirofilaria immitis]